MTTESMGFMLQGVSQQQPKVRLPGQVTEQVNMLSDIEKGLTSRPPSDLIGTLSTNVADNTKSVTVKIDQELFRIIMRDGQLPRVIDYSAIERSVTGSNAAYCSTDGACYVYDKVMYMTNRNALVLQDTTYDPRADIISPYAYAYVLGGAFRKTFRITIRFGTFSVSGEYSTPDGSDAGEAERASSDYIMQRLYDDLLANLSAGGHTGFVSARFENYMYIRRTSGAPVVSLSTRDGESNTYLNGGIGEAKDVADLPKYAVNGALVKIVGDSSAKDDFWMRFTANDETTPIGGGFGKEGIWREHFDPAAAFRFNANTMPHILEKQPDGSFVFGPETWEDRRVGNDDSNLTPSFVGSSIRDVREMQGRLTFCTSASTVVQSRVDFPRDFWKRSAVADNVTDPIDMRATDEGTIPLEYMVSLDKDLYVFAENAQFAISGQGKLTPATASTALSTRYALSVSTRPTGTGRTVLLPFVGARYSGINEYFTTDDFSTQAMDNISKTASKYIDGEVTDMAVSSNDGLAFFLTTKSATTGQVWVYKYLWEGTTKTQSAWSKWEFPGHVRHVYCEAGVLYVWLRIPATRATVAHEVLLQVRLDTPSNDQLGYSVCLDAQEFVNINVNNPAQEFVTIRSQRKHLTFVLLSQDDDSPAGDLIVPDEVVQVGNLMQYRFRRREREWLDHATVLYGLPYDRFVTLTRPFARDQNGNARSDVQIVLRTLYVDYNDSGQFEVWMRSGIRGDAIMGNTDWFPMDNDPFTPWEINVRSGTLQIPWGEYAQYADIEIRSDDVRPTTVMEVRYDPEYLKDGG